MVKQLLLGLALCGAMVLSATEGVSDMAVQLFGKESATKRVDKGAVFIDGLYVKAPYSVTREGNVILINGQIASRFKVESAVAGAMATAREAAKNDPAMQGGEISEEAGATIGSDDTPTLETTSKGTKAPAGKKPSALEAKIAKQYANGTGLDAKIAAQKKAKELKEASAKGSFNESSSGTGETMALFEEADYTYTPPAKPEPPAVPYVRPAAKASFAETAAKNKARAAEVAAKAAAAASGAKEDEESEEIATEDFENLSEEEIAAITKKVADRRALLEKLLEADSLILLSANTSAAKTQKKAVMLRFVASLEKLCSASSADALVKQWGKTLPAGYLRKIYDNRESNAPEMKTLILRVNREQKEAKERSSRRL